MRGFIKFIFISGIVVLSLKLGCSKFAEFSMNQNMTRVCGLTYDQAIDQMSTFSCPNSDPVEELQKIYKKHWYWDLTDEQRNHFYKLLSDPCNAPPDPNNQLQSGIQELLEIALLAYFAYFYYTIPITLVIIFVILSTIYDNSTKTVETAIKDIKEPIDKTSRKERKQDALENDV